MKVIIFLFGLLILIILSIFIILLISKNKENFDKNLSNTNDLPSPGQNGPDFCQLYPDAPGCSPFGNLTIGDFCEENPDNYFCRNLVIDICKNNPDISICKDPRSTVNNICDNFPLLDKCKSRLERLCEQYPSICLPRKLNFDIKPNTPPSLDLEKISKSNGICFSGGGLRSFVSHHGAMNALLKHQQEMKNNPKLKFNDLFKKTDFIGAISGGSWYASMLLYDKKFNDGINNLRVINKNSISTNLYDNYLSIMRSKRSQLNSIGNFSDILDVPFFIDYLLTVYDTIFPSSLGLLIPWEDVVEKMVLLDRLNNTKMKNLLVPFKNIDVSFGSGILVDATLDINTTTPHFSYVLNPNFSCSQMPDYKDHSLKFPCNPGPHDIIDFKGTTIQTKDSRGNYFNQYNGSNEWPEFDNTVFDTCQYNPAFGLYCDYKTGFCDAYPLDFNVYRCQNVGMAECCRNNSKFNQTPTTIPIFITSNRNQSFMINRSIPIQYVAYNYQTEKEPTGPMNDESYFRDIDTNSRRVALYNRNGITRSMINNYDTSKEIVSKAATASGGFLGFIASPCYLKSALYGGGFSDQEMLFNNVKTVLSYAGVPVLNINSPTESKIHRTVCDSVDNKICTNREGCTLLCSPNRDFDWNNSLKLFNDNLAVRLTDGGNVDGLGLVAAIRSHQTKYGNIGEMNIICIMSCNFDSTTKATDIQEDPRLSEYANLTRAVFKNYVFDEDRPLVYDINSKDMMCDLPNQVNSIINRLANFNILEEIGTGLAAALVEVIIAAIIPILGPLVAITLLPFTVSLAYEIIDLDTDYHVLTDNYGKKFDSCANLFYKPTILDRDFDRPDTKSRMIFKDNGKISANILHYKNVELLTNEFLGVFKGTKLKNLYIIQGFLDSTDYGRFPIMETDESTFRKYGNGAGFIFEAVNDILRDDRRFRTILSTF